jgi:CDP-diglyceride synthetase
MEVLPVKGIEGLPFKYMLTLIVAMIIIAAMFLVLNQFSSTALALTHSANSTLHDVLNSSLGRALK